MKEANERIELFSEEEKEIIKKEYCYDRRSRANDSQSLFTEQNIDSTLNELTKNVSSKSVILAPFNTTQSDVSEKQDYTQDLIIEKKEIIKFAAKVRDIDRQYEKNNNEDIDQGVDNMLMCGSKDDKMSSEESSDSLNNSFNSGEHNSFKRNTEIIPDQEKPSSAKKIIHKRTESLIISTIVCV